RPVHGRAAGVGPQTEHAGHHQAARRHYGGLFRENGLNSGQWSVVSGQWPEKTKSVPVFSDHCPLTTDHCPGDTDMSDTGIAIPETSRRLKEEREQERKKQPPYHVVLFNDDDHSFDYVIGMLQQLFGHQRQKGFLMAYEVHTKGRV